MYPITFSSVLSKAEQACGKYWWQYLASLAISIILYIVMLTILIFSAVSTVIGLIFSPLGNKSIGFSISSLIGIAVLLIVIKIVEYLFNQGTLFLMIDSGSGQIPRKQVCLGFLRLFFNGKMLLGTLMIAILKVLFAWSWVIIPIILDLILTPYIPFFGIIDLILIITGYIIAIIKTFGYSMASYIYYRSVLAGNPIGYTQALATSNSYMNGHKGTLFSLNFCFGLIILVIRFIINLLSAILGGSLTLVSCGGIVAIGVAVFGQIAVAMLIYKVFNQGQSSYHPGLGTPSQPNYGMVNHYTDNDDSIDAKYHD